MFEVKEPKNSRIVLQLQVYRQRYKWHFADYANVSLALLVR